MREAISRRALCAASILTAACGRSAEPYVGRTTLPDRERLCYVLGGGPSSLDPAYYSGGFEGFVTPALFPQGLSQDGRAFRFETLIPTLPHSRPIAEMLQQQWRENLHIHSDVVLQEFNVWMQNMFAVNYSAIAEGGGWPDYLDPKGMFDWFANGSALNGTGYADAAFDSLLAETDNAPDPVTRMQRLADCERYLLKSMPVVPIFHNVWLYLQKPFVRGLAGNALDKHPFKYVWIDRQWRPS